MTFETFDQRDEETWPDQQKENEKDNEKKTKTMTMTFRERLQRAPPETCNFWHFWSEWWGDITWLAKRQWQRQIQWKRQRQWQLQKHPQRTISETCGLCDTGYISDNWEQQSEHSQWPLNKEWQGQHSQFLRCFTFFWYKNSDKSCGV